MSRARANSSSAVLVARFPAIPCKGNLLQYGILERLGRTQPHDGLGLDLDRFASLRIAAHTRLAVRLHNAADARNDELARAALGFLYRELEEFFKEGAAVFLGVLTFSARCDTILVLLSGLAAI